MLPSAQHRGGCTCLSHPRASSAISLAPATEASSSTGGNKLGLFVERRELVRDGDMSYTRQRTKRPSAARLRGTDQRRAGANGARPAASLRIRINGSAALTLDRRGDVKWMTENAITVAAFEQLVNDRRVDQCVAFQQADGWFIVLAKVSRERDVRFVATFREMSKPRRFSRLDVLFKLLHDSLGYSGVIQVLPYSTGGVAKRLEAL